jgi:hypothetical protein
MEVRDGEVIQIFRTILNLKLWKELGINIPMPFLRITPLS